MLMSARLYIIYRQRQELRINNNYYDAYKHDYHIYYDSYKYIHNVYLNSHDNNIHYNPY